MFWRKLASVASEAQLRRHGIFCLWLAAALVAVFTVGAGGGPARVEDSDDDKLFREWKDLLQLASVHDKNAFERISAVRKEGREPLSRLAAVLIEEWNVDRSEERFSRPMRLVEPKIEADSLPEEEKKLARHTAEVMGTVSIGGRFTNAKLINSSGNPRVDQMVIDSGERTLFRPAYGPQGFKESFYMLSLRFHIR